jgi:hypothetical protein
MASPQLIPDGVALERVPGLTAGQIKALENCWIATAQEFVALAECPEVVTGPLLRTLGVDRVGLERLVQAARRLVPAERDLRALDLADRAAAAEYRTGALLDEPTEELARRQALPPYIAGSLRALPPASVSHLQRLPPLRDQGGRGTCVAHAVVAVREFLEVAAGGPPDQDLSEQFVYWWCKEHDGIPAVSGAYVSVAMRCLLEAGAPAESAWPYVNYERGNDQGQGPPPDGAANGDPAMRTLRTLELNRSDIAGIKACIAEERAVAFSIPVFDSWYYAAATRRWGKITLPLNGEVEDGGHAMALVGYQDDRSAPGGGYFLVRNSWQPWAYDGVWQTGYGYIPYAYISRYATAVASAVRMEGADVWVRDNEADVGRRPLAQAVWRSPDIWVRRQPDGEREPEAPAADRANAVYLRVANLGPAYAYYVQAEVWAAPLAPRIRPADWRPIGRLAIEQLAPGPCVLGPLSWTPAEARPYAFQVRVDSVEDPLDRPLDPAGNNNVALSHLWVAPVCAGGTCEVVFDAVEAPDADGEIEFLVEPLPPGSPVAVSPPVLQPTTLGRDLAQDDRDVAEDAVLGALTGGLVLTAGRRRLASMTIAADPDAQPGAHYSFAVAQVQGSQLVGWMTVRVDVTSSG